MRASVTRSWRALSTRSPGGGDPSREMVGVPLGVAPGVPRASITGIQDEGQVARMQHISIAS
jgi:hypothetical protein